MSKAIVTSTVTESSAGSTVKLRAGGRTGPRSVTATRLTGADGQIGWIATDDATGATITRRPIRHLRDLRHAVNNWARAHG